MRPSSTIQDLINFLNKSVCNFLAVDTITKMLDAEGFTRLDPRQAWTIEPGGRYYVTANASAIFPFIAGTGAPHEGFRIISAHSDSPGFRIKPNPFISHEGGWGTVNTEVYGGPILYTWFDRPLSVAGRVILRSDDPFNPLQVPVICKRPLLTIPHLAIHFNRSVNEGNPLSKQRDMLPVIGQIVNGVPMFQDIIRQSLPDALSDREILDFDLSLYDCTPACLVGMRDEMITSGRLDDLSMVFAAVDALLTTADKPCRQTRVAAIFDNEETGSGTKQGADSPMFTAVMQRVVKALGGVDEDYYRAVASSFMVSADNAHGVHPNYPGKYDPTNRPVLGEGPVIKINANCKYMTDADSSAVFAQVCEAAGVPYQYFVNHSDSAGGSTLGNKLTSQVNLRGVDMGAPIWAMHSVRETGAVVDHYYTVKAFESFYTLEA